MIKIFINIPLILVNCCLIFKFFHIFQLKDYDFKRYFKHFSKFLYFFEFLNLLIYIFNLIYFNIFIYIILNLIIFCLSIFLFKTLIRTNKTPLHLTAKMKRMILLSTITVLVVGIFISPFLISSLLIFLPPSICMINIYDKILNQYYIKKAKKKLATHKAKIIAITGSNGKTSVKNILCEFLSLNYSVQATPSSFNTPLGISKFINNQLKDNTQFLILEYGARRIGDIKKLCNLFGADYGIVTMIGKQHLETFKSLDNIYLAKKELPDFLNDNLCIYNLDNNLSKEMYHQKNGKRIGVSISKNADVFANDIQIKNFKTQFKINNKNQVTTSLLGEHNVTNILLAFALSKQLNISEEKMISAIENLKPTPHRLEYINSNFNILDDSYNCSLASAKSALDVLRQTEHKKMIVTPGIVEAGKESYKTNFLLGAMLAEFDYLVIIGEFNKNAILDGIKTQKNSKLLIFESKTLENASNYYKFLKKEDCLLFLNDLPDDYN